MQSFKKTVAIAIVLNFIGASVAVVASAQEKDTQSGVKLPAEMPEKELEKMRDAMRGKGDYALPASSLNDSTMPEQERKNMQSTLERMRQEQEKIKEQGLLDGFDKKSQMKQAEAYRELAENVGGQSQSGLEKALQEYNGLSESEAKGFVGKDPTSKRQAKTEHAIFASFSMEEDALRNVFIRAKQQDAEVYFKGMHPSHRRINETMQMVRRIGNGIENPPMTQFNPSAFEKYEVTQVPTILYRDGDKYAKASGILNLDWVKDKAEEADESVDLGVFGATSEVAEKSIIEVFRERMAGIDWEAKKKKAVDEFWQNRNFETLPSATEDKTFFIDPTVRVRNDISTPDGRHLASKGEVINPLATRKASVTMLIFDAKDNKEVEWVTKQLSSGQLKGRVMLMATRVDRKKGWDHLQALHDHFNRQIFLLPKQLVNKFKLTGSPAIVSTELERELMKIQQFNLKGEQS